MYLLRVVITLLSNYAYLGYSGEGDNFKIGSNADYNRLNARANLDMNVNDFINVEFGFFGGTDNSQLIPTMDMIKIMGRIIVMMRNWIFLNLIRL